MYNNGLDNCCVFCKLQFCFWCVCIFMLPIPLCPSCACGTGTRGNFQNLGLTNHQHYKFLVPKKSFNVKKKKKKNPPNRQEG